MDSVFHERVAAIREHVCILKDRRGEHNDICDRRKCAEWLDYRRKADHEILTIVSDALRPAAAQESDHD